MPPGVPGADLTLLMCLTRRLTGCRLHAYHPGSRRSAAALVFRFDDETQRTLAGALRTFRAATGRYVSAGPGMADEKVSGAASSPRGIDQSPSFFSSAAPSTTSSSRPDSSRDRRTDPLAFFEYLAHRNLHHQHASFVDASAPSSLQLLFLKRANVEATGWSGRIVFPGGRRDRNDHDDFDTVCRQTDEAIGLSLQHCREFLCLGRLPDYRLHSHVIDSRDLVQVRFVFLHVGDVTPTVRLAAHEVEGLRWVPLHMLAAAHVERGQVVYPLQNFSNPQDADARLMLGEAFGNTYLYFPSILLPSVPVPPSSPASAEGTEADGNECRDDGEKSKMRDEASTASPESLPWRVWGLTFRTVNELLALGGHRTHDWPLVASNSSLLQYGVLFPLHGYYELLYQLYWWRAWMFASMRLRHRSGCASACGAANTGDGQPNGGLSNASRSGSPPSNSPSTFSREQQRWERVLYGSSMERRDAVLPASADAMLFAVPETPITKHVVSLAAVVGCAVLLLYTAAAVIASACAAVGSALDRDAERQLERRYQAYHDATTSSSLAHYRRRAAGAAELRSSGSAAPGSGTVIAANDAIGSNSEAGFSHYCLPRQLREDCGVNSSSIADEAALSAELRSSTEAPHGEPLLDRDSALVQETGRVPHTVTPTSGVQQHLPTTRWARMDSKPTGDDAGAESLTVSSSQLTTPTDHLTAPSAASTASVVEITERGSVCCYEADLRDRRATGTEWGEVGPAVTGISLPAERPVEAAMLTAVAELSHEEELEVIMRRYRTQAAANQ